MAEYKYYYPNGTEMNNFGEFVDFYSKVYYFKSSDMWLENRMDKILKEGIERKEDIGDIFCWKIGGNYEDDPLKVYNQYHSKAKNKPLCLEKVWETVNKYRHTDLTKDENIKTVIKELLDKENNCKGIGPTYALTVIYFLSKGEYPIYDRYAYIALNKIRESAKKTLFNRYLQTTLFKTNDLPKKVTNGASNKDAIFMEYNVVFKAPLEELLNAESEKAGYEKDYYKKKYKESRDIDRALWTYGHLFNENKENEKRTKEYAESKEKL